MSAPKGGDGPDDTGQTALHPQRQGEYETSHVAEVSELGGAIDEPTMQGASYLVERITPVPPARGAPPTQLSNPTVAPAVNEEATAAVANPGPRPAPLRVDATGATMGLAPLTRAHDAPPDVDTAYVPLPGQAPPPAAGMGPAGERATVVAGAVKVPSKAAGLVEKIRGSKNARLGIIAVSGVLAMGITVLVLGPKPQQPQTPAPMIRADPGPGRAQQQPQERPPEAPADPAKVEERDQLLERAILAVESGRIDEALALFRRYTEEESSPAAEFMVQLLQMQLSQTGKEP